MVFSFSFVLIIVLGGERMTKRGHGKFFLLLLPEFASSDFFKLMYSFPIEGNKTYMFQILFALSHVF